MATGLAAFVPERADVKTKSTTLSMRGLALVDVTRLVTFHLAEIEQAYARFERVKAQIYSRQATDEFFFGLASDFPLLIAEVISTACDEHDAIEQASKLPLGTQLECLQTIARLTFEEAGGIKNWSASLIKSIRDALPAEVLNRLATTRPLTGQPSKESIGASEKT